MTDSQQDLEEIVMRLLRKALQSDELTVTDNLVEHGLDSLVATRFIADLRKELGISIPLVEIFEVDNAQEFTESLRELLAEQAATA
ncbi:MULTISPECIES: acyl carrier protein [unclassified Micromonospora]|uniref:acyl carrier protein n=1 Tax=unclassified Micromonospora TaxID=2617518 RepID=UPI00249BC32E|nr:MULTISPECIES: acyl carrier protein [unclassified Micromonospora]WFE54855.1 acyl carrier protein [Micromonospora sp. WMMD1155]WFE98623.1 acyl carrier protein [Micromonospora sp. WMMD964]